MFFHTKLILPDWIPRQCKPLLECCSGYYNHPDIQWKEWSTSQQVLHLASILKSPRNMKCCSWELLIHDISEMKRFVDEDPNVPPATVRKVINHLCHFPH